MECVVEASAYHALYDAITHSSHTSSLPKSIVNAIISYLCYHKFYFGVDCTVNIKTAQITFNLFDINARLCYTLISKISQNSLNWMQSKLEKQTGNVIKFQFIGNEQSYQMQHKSMFILQRSALCFLMSWNEHKQSEIPFIELIKCFELSSSKLHCQTLITMSNHCTFIPLRKCLTSHSPQCIEINSTNALRAPIIKHRTFDTYQHYMSNGHNLSSNDHAFPILFASTDKMINLLANNALFESVMQRSSQICDYYAVSLNVFDRSPGLEFIGKFTSFYLNIAGMNRAHDRMEQIGKIWISTEYRGGFKYSVCGLEVIDRKLLMIYKDYQTSKVFISYFVVGDQVEHQRNEGDIFYILECVKKTEIKSGGTLVGNLKFLKSVKQNLMILRFKLKTRNFVSEYLVNERLQIMEEHKIDIVGIDYSLFWNGKLFCDFGLEIGRDLIVMKENDVALKTQMTRNHFKSLTIDGVIVTGSIAALGAIFWAMSKI